MNSPAPTQASTQSRRAHVVWCPPFWAESAFYFTVFYSVVSGYLGIEVPLLAAGLRVGLAVFFLSQLGARAKTLCAPIALLLACQISFVFVQIAVHGVSPTESSIREFVLLICGMIIVQSLSLREGFLKRATIVIFLIGLIAVPYLTFEHDERAAAEIALAGNLTNANGLAAWFGFCVISFAVSGLQATSNITKIVYWSVAAGSLVIVGLTVSRGAILGIALALTFAARRLLKRGFLPLLLLIALTGTLYVSGIIDPIVSSYVERGTEETGRFLIWPEVIDRVINSPIIGVGLSDLFTDVNGKPSMPHNSYLFFALTSGVVPFVLWVSFWIRSGLRSLSVTDRSEYAPYRVPFWVYAFVGTWFGDIGSDAWLLITFALGAGAIASRRINRFPVLQRSRAHRTAAPPPRPSSKAATQQ